MNIVTEPTTLPEVKPGKTKPEKTFGQKTIKFYYRSPDPHIERVLWYISHLHKKVWNHMQDICNGNLDLIDTLFDQVNIKGQEEIQKIRESIQVITREDGSTYTKSKSLSEFGMLYCLGPVRNADPELLQICALDAQKPAKVLAKSWKSFYELNKRGDTFARPPRYKNELFFYTIQSDQITLTDTCCIRINHKILGIGEILIPLPKYVCELVTDKKVRFVTIKRTHADVNRASDFEINLVYETELVEKKPITDETRIAGVDLGSRKITVVVSDDPSRVKTYHLREFDKYFTKQRQQIEARMKTRKKGSKSWQKLADAITKLSNKWHNSQKDVQRKIAHDIIQKADLFYVGNQAVRLGLARSDDGTKSEHRAVQNTGNMSRMITYLTEKATETGKTVVKVKDHKPSGKNTSEQIKIIGAVRNMEMGITHHKNMVMK